MTAIVVGVRKEDSPGEHRVALAPDGVSRLVAAGMRVLVETEAGRGARFDDKAYVEAGAEVVDVAAVSAGADLIVAIGKPAAASLRPGQAVLGLLNPLAHPAYVAALAERGVTALSLDGIPRTLSRAQTMDALSSQANIAGYKAVLVAANAFERYFPLLITAAGTAKPATVLVLGAGVAGLQAIGTARRLGAVVHGYDVRPQSRAEVQSLGASFIQLTSVSDAAGSGGYARALTPEEQAAQQAELGEHIARHDIVITTAQVPGRRPPLLVTAEAVGAMNAGSVVVDVAASALGGNVAGSEPDRTITTDNGVLIIGAGNLPATMPTAASSAYSRNVSALLLHLVTDGALVLDQKDEITAGVLLTRDGAVVHPATAQILEGS
jgi:NAD(P) transhydrogenase subunit alpha